MYRADQTSSCLSAADALAMRDEIKSLRKEKPEENWYDTVRRYRDRLNIDLFGAEEGGSYEFCVDCAREKQKFNVSDGFAAALKLTKIENTIARYEKTFTFGGCGLRL